MKYISNLFKALVALLLFSCAEEEILTIKPVDLRFDAEKQYIIGAKSADTIMFQVCSTSPWEVYGQNSAWSDISPATGRAGLDSITTVKIAYHDNDHLDDRIDTIIIQSDYWIGTWVEVVQKGTAYLHLASDSTFVVESVQSNGTFVVESNQKWTCEVAEDAASWLSITSSETGEGNGQVEFAAIENKGEIRTGEIKIKDRHGVHVKTVTVNQHGLILTPDALELRTYFDQPSVTVRLESNSEWEVYKLDDQAEWYDFDVTSGENDGAITITLQNNGTPEVKVAQFVISTKQVEGITPVTRTITLKQAFDNKPVKKLFNAGEMALWTVDGGYGDGEFTFGDAGLAFTGKTRMTRTLPVGRYDFEVQYEPNSENYLNFTYDLAEFRWYLSSETGSTDISTTPWSDAHNATSDDFTKPQIISLDLSDAGDGYIKAEWYLNGKLINTLATTQAWVGHSNIPDETTIQWPRDPFVYLGCFKGSVTYLSYTYTEPIMW